ncbi:site-specific DNA-methyltransferase [Helicobacter anatolicus]|uniref:site-specific DNA-methyltransferase n=1 Tax=Helicobacter anatolicus TaxID=2905874 RepID=UPI001E40B2B4|nr:site-specific DNA-methyltransferase [Helicobacter anatolicus]MCE3038349.1 site-specific DNA-methyltransferase [Helicobacter anatolicus]
MIDKQKAQQNGLNIIDSTKENNPLKSILEKHFPNTLSEGQVNLKALAMLLGLDSHSNTQGYELTFTGKGLANTLYTTPVEYELKEEVEIGKERELTENSVIIGDNLDVLKILKSAYYEKIKMIYIDPPYNTKSENFIYPDDFRKDYKKILREVGLLEIDEEGNEIESKTLQTFRNITGSRSHSGWLSFMLPRLKLSRDLLREDGVIFISIDDNEQANLKILCDEIFGEENFVGDFIRKTKSTTNDAKIGINYQHEFLLCYAKNKESANLLGGQKDLSKYKNPDNDPNGTWISTDPSAKSGNIETGYFAVENPYTGKIDYPPKGMFWRFSKNTIQKHIDEGRICFKKEHREDERGFIYKRYLKDLKTNLKTFDSLVFTNNLFMNQRATKDLIKLNMVEYFSYPKGVEFIKTILNHSTNKDSDLILDFFAGSGTTAQAVMELNAEDGGNRKFILVQLPEEIKEDKNKIAYDFVRNELGRSKPKISDITIERVNRAGEKLRGESGEEFSVDIGYRVYSLREKARLSDEGSIIPHSANITPSDIARNLALFAGKPLHIPLEELVKDKLFSCEDILCVVEIDKEAELKILEDKNKAIFIDGYGTYTLESFLNLNIPNNERVNVVY